jgi:hypothetical protein
MHWGLIFATLGLASCAVTPWDWLIAAEQEAADRDAEDADVAAFMRAKRPARRKCWTVGGPRTLTWSSMARTKCTA